MIAVDFCFWPVHPGNFQAVSTFWIFAVWILNSWCGVEENRWYHLQLYTSNASKARLESVSGLTALRDIFTQI